MTIATRQECARVAGPRASVRPPADTVRVDIPLSLLDSRDLTPADIGAGILLLAWQRRDGIANPAALAFRFGISPREAEQHIGRLVSAGLKLGGNR